MSLLFSVAETQESRRGLKKMPLRYSLEFDDPFCVAFPSSDEDTLERKEGGQEACYTELAVCGSKGSPKSDQASCAVGGAGDIEDPEKLPSPTIRMFSSSLHHAAHYELDYGRGPVHHRGRYDGAYREPPQCVLQNPCVWIATFLFVTAIVFISLRS